MHLRWGIAVSRRVRYLAQSGMTFSTIGFIWERRDGVDRVKSRTAIILLLLTLLPLPGFRTYWRNMTIIRKERRGMSICYVAWSIPWMLIARAL
ncbi:hypothetical protein ACFLVN_00450 [Chloroflexota bacterium]